MAPTTTSALHPIVIDPFQVPPHFTTLGTGLLYDSHARESASTLKTLLLSKPPLLTNQSKPKSWWRAQCLLYGLNAPGNRTVQDLRETLETALGQPGGLAVPREFVELEHKENGKFRKLNAQVREATGRGAVGVKESKGRVNSTASKENNKPTAKAPKPMAGKGAVASFGKEKKAATQKDPLKVVKGSPKIKKSQPANNSSASINLSITIMGAQAALTQPKSTVRKRATIADPSVKQKSTKASSASTLQSAPKPPRAKPAAKKNLSDKTGTESSPSKTQPRTKKAAVKATGSNTFKTEPDAPKQKVARVKQTARRAKIEPKIEKKEPRDYWEDEMEMREIDDAYYYDSDGYRISAY